MAKLRLKKSEQLKDEVIKKRQKEIKKLYEEVAKDIQKELSYYSKLDTAIGALKTQQLNDLQKDLQSKLENINQQIGAGIQSDVNSISNSVQGSMNQWLDKFGLGLKYASVPDSVVQDVLFGDVYNKKNYLSKRIWDITRKELNDINAIVAKGLAENKGVYDIAKDLEKYVSPSAKKDWEWSKVYPGTNKVVDYNAQRLARTLSQHAFQRSFERSAEKNPFVEGYVWLSAFVHGRTCQICKDRDGQFYKKGKLPMDHPNGLCTWELKMQSTKDVGKQIEDWLDAPTGTYPELDKFAESLESKFSKFFPNDKQGVNNLVNKAVEAFSKEAYDKVLEANKVRDFEKIYDSYMDDLDEELRDAITEYTSMSYHIINDYLRGIEGCSSTLNGTDIKEIEALINKGLGKTSQDFVVRRGSDFESLEGMLGQKNLDIMNVDEIKQNIVGKIGSDAGFLSTTPISSKGFHDEINYIIKVPQGTTGAYVASISKFPRECEFLLGSGNKFLIRDVVLGKYHVLNVYMEVI